MNFLRNTAVVHFSINCAGLSMFKGSKHVVFTLTNDSLYFRTNIDVNQFDDNFIEDIEPLSLSCE